MAERRLANTIFDRHYVSKHSGDFHEPGICPRPGCHRDLVRLGKDLQRHCSRECRKDTYLLPEPERSERRALTDGIHCIACGKRLPNPVYRCPKVRNAWVKNWRTHAGGKLRFGPEAWEWLAGKLGIPYPDDRLPDIAWKLAQSGKLTIAVDGDVIIGMAKPKERNENE